MKTKIAEITAAIAGIENCQFASLTYLSKGNEDLARYTVNLGFNYNTAVQKSVTELELLMAENETVWTALQKEAATEVMASLKKTLAAHEVGEQNDDYTKKGQYIPIGNGLNLNTVDNTIQLFGLVNSKVVLKEGKPKKATKSAPLTIEKNKLRRMLPVGKFREFALDVANIGQVKTNGETIELSNADGFTFEINPPAAVTLNPETVTA